MILTAAAVAALIAQCVPELPSDLIPLATRIAMHESGGNTLVPNHHNTNGTVDGGLMQINSANWPRFGLTQATILNECSNIRAGTAILEEGLSRYNTGRITTGGMAYADAVLQDKKISLNPLPRSNAPKEDENWRMFESGQADQIFSHTEDVQ